MSSLESKIDDLYKESLTGFVPARTALVKTLRGDEARRVQQLQKPLAVPWAVNQVYWYARPVYDRLLKTGGTRRATQIAALGGRPADVHAAADAHRAAVAGAVAEALRLAAAEGLTPDADALSHTFETVSLTNAPTEPPGRLTKPLRPAGFEALAGVTVKAAAHVRASAHVPSEKASATREALSTRPSPDARLRERRDAAAERQRLAAIEKAQRAVERAQTAEAAARAEWERCKRDLDDATRALGHLRR